MRRFEGRAALITGAAGGLGRAFATAFAAEGAHAILLDRDAAGLAATRALIADAGGQADSHCIDLADEATIHGVADAIMAASPALDVLVNNAGLHAGTIARGYSGLGLADWQHFFGINCFAPLLLADALRPALAAAHGVIINISSMASFAPATAYGLTKSTLNAITFAMATHYGADGIRAVGIAPGLMDTEAARQGVEPANWERLRAMQQVARQGTPRDIVELGLFLASEAGGFINNETILADGGNAMRGWR